MRLPFIPPAELSPEQKLLYDDMKSRHCCEIQHLQDHATGRGDTRAMERLAA
jgi:hypothetical protein